MVVSISNNLDMDPAETKALNLLERLEKREIIKEKTGKLLTTVAIKKFRVKNKSRGIRKNKRDDTYFSSIKKQFEDLRKINR